MTTTPTRPPTATAPSGAGPSSDEKAAAGVFTVGALLLGGPGAAIIAALAVGIEQAFVKSGWDRPDWFSRPPMSAEELTDRRQRLAGEASAQLAEARARAAIRAAARKEHYQKISDWVTGGKDGDKPDRPQMRNPWQFLSDAAGTSKSWYRLFDDKTAKAGEKITGTYPKIGEFLTGLWGFLSGFCEGTARGWREYHQKNSAGDPAQQPEPTNGPDWSAADPRPVDGTDWPAVDPAPTSASTPEPPDSGPTPPPSVGPTDLQPEQLTGGTGTADATTGPAGPGTGTAIEGEVMSADGTPVPAGAAGTATPHMGPQGETNLDLMYQAMFPAGPLLDSIAVQVAELRPDQIELLALTAELQARCALFGAPLTTHHMIAECAAIGQALTTGLTEVDLRNETARQLTGAALQGLRPVQENLEATHAQGASGDLYNRVDH